MSSDEAMLSKFNKITPVYFYSSLRNTVRHWILVKMPHIVLPTYHMISSMSSDKTFYFVARILFLLGVPWWRNRGRGRGGGAPGPASAPQEPVSTWKENRGMFTRRQQGACSWGFFETWSICSLVRIGSPRLPPSACECVPPPEPKEGGGATRDTYQ